MEIEPTVTCEIEQHTYIVLQESFYSELTRKHKAQAFDYPNKLARIPIESDAV